MDYNINPSPPTPFPDHIPSWATGRLHKVELSRGDNGLVRPVSVDVCYCEADGECCLSDTTAAFSVDEEGQTFELQLSIAFGETVSKELLKNLQEIDVDCYHLIEAINAASLELDRCPRDQVDCDIIVNHPVVPSWLAVTIYSTVLIP